VAFTPSGQTLASCGSDNTVRNRDHVSGTSHVLAHCHRPEDVAFSPDGSELAWNQAEGIFRYSFQAERVRKLRGWANYVAYSPDGKHLATSGSVLRIWDRRSSRIVRSERERIPTNAEAAAWLGSPSCSAFSPDGNEFASSRFLHRWGKTALNLIRVEDILSGRERLRLPLHSMWTFSLAFSPDGRYLAAPCASMLHAWDVHSGQPLARAQIDRRYFGDVAFTPDSRFLAAAHRDGAVRFYDTTNWLQHVAFDWDIGPLVSLDIARDGLRAAAGSKCGKIVVWDIDF
jgi:WD40 repeat protein